ncbi:MAG: hypothetical protein ACOX7N_09180 [Lawsonibacter sp.]|jgi:hypothetical protein
MKIYNKKSFAEGAFMLALGTLNLVLPVINHTFEGKDAILTFVLYFLGGGFLFRSVSLKCAREDKLDKMDERNQLIEWKSQSKSFRLTQAASFLLMLGLFIMGKLSGYDRFITIGIGLAFAFSISIFAEIGTYMYYEAKN